MRNLLKAIIVITSCCLTLAVNAQTKVVVIPMAGDNLKPLANVITVAKQNGDFSNPQDALNSISGSEPKIVIIAPGTYLVSGQLRIPANVHLAGSGRKQTILQISGGASDSLTTDTAYSNSALVTMSSNTELSSLSVEMSALAGNVVGVFAKTSLGGAIINDVNIEVTNPATVATVGIATGNTSSQVVIKDSAISIESQLGNREYVGVNIRAARQSVISNTNISAGNISANGGLASGVLVRDNSANSPTRIDNSTIQARLGTSGTVTAFSTDEGSGSRAVLINQSLLFATGGSGATTRIAASGAFKARHSIIFGPVVEGEAGASGQRCVFSSGSPVAFILTNGTSPLDTSCSVLE